MKEPTLEELKTLFAERGFKFQSMDRDLFRPGIFYKRIETKRACTSNDKDQLVVHLHDMETLPGGHPHRWSFTVDLTGEFPPGLWGKLEVYGLRETELFENLPRIEAALIRAWEALA